jgi:hypothetical protein
MRRLGLANGFPASGKWVILGKSVEHKREENPMFVARWQIDARFGHKQAVIDLMRHWLKEIGTKAGTDKMDVKLLTDCHLSTS